MRALLGITWGIIIYLIFFWFIQEVSGDPKIAFVVGIIATSILYFLVVCPNVTFIVPENKAWIMSNQFKRESDEYDTESGFRVIKAQKEFQAGFHWKFLWEKKGEEIEMKKVISIEGDPEETYTLQDKSIVKLKYIILAMPMPGRIVNFNKTRPEDITRKVNARTTEFLQGYFGDKTSVSFGASGQKELDGKIDEFWKTDTIRREDEKMGIWTKPEVYDIDEPKSVQDARNFQKGMKSVIAVAREMVAGSGGQLSYAQAMQLAMVGRGNVDMDLVQLSGVFPQLGGKSKAKSSGKKKGKQADDDE